MKTTIRRCFNAVLLAVMALFLSTCNDSIVGLGSAIDITPPTMTIDGPSTTIKALKGPFLLHGTISDDRGIKNITVTLQKSLGNNVFGEAETISIPAGSIQKLTAQDYEWSIMLNNKNGESYPLSDGTYNIRVLGTDFADKPVEAESVVTIDNTPPLFVVNRPSTMGETKGDLFGDELWLEGQTADTAGVKKLRLTAYDVLTGRALKTLELNTNIPPTVRLKLDSFNNPKTDDKFYRTIYAEEEPKGDKGFYCAIELWDGAEEYTTKDGRTAEGNYTDTYYLYAPLVNKIVFPKYTIDELYQMHAGLGAYAVKGNASRSADAVKAEITPIIEGLKKGRFEGQTEPFKVTKPADSFVLAEAKKSLGTFTLNPLVDPHFEVIGYTPVARNAVVPNNWPDITVGSSISVKISPNTDNVPLHKNFKFYAIKSDAFDRYNEVYAQYKDKSINEIAAEINKIPGVAALRVEDSAVNPQGASYLAVVLMDKTKLEVGSSYILRVLGEDKDTHRLLPHAKKSTGEIVPYGEFCFRILGVGAPPELKVTDIQGVSGTNTITPHPDNPHVTKLVHVKKGDSLAFAVSVGGEEFPVDVTYRLVDDTGKTLMHNGAEVSATERVERSIPMPPEGVSKVFTVDASKIPQTISANYGLKIIAKSTLNLKETERSCQLYYDTEPPLLTVNIPDGTLYPAMPRVSGSVLDVGCGTDFDLLKAEYSYNNGPVQDWLFKTKAGSWELEPLAAPKEGTYSLTITAFDKLGQAERVIRTFKYDKAVPCVTRINTSPVTENTTEIPEQLYNNTRDVRIGVTFVETNKIAAIKYGRKGMGLVPLAPLPSADTSGSHQISLSLPSGQEITEDGKYTVQLELEDEFGRTASRDIPILVDTENPAFEKMTVAGTDFTAAASSFAANGSVTAFSSTVSVKGTFVDKGSGIDKVVAQYKESPSDAEDKKAEFTPRFIGNGKYDIDGSISLPLGTTSVTVTVHDKVGKTVVWNVNVTVENSALDLRLGMKPVTPSYTKDGAVHVEDSFDITVQGIYTGAVPLPLELTVTKDGAAANLTGFYMSTTPGDNIPVAGNKLTGFNSGKKDSPAPEYSIRFTPRNTTADSHQDDGRYVFTLKWGTVKTEHVVVVDTKKPDITPVYPQDRAPFFPGKAVKASFFDASGVKNAKVHYKYYRYDTLTKTYTENTSGEVTLSPPAYEVKIADDSGTPSTGQMSEIKEGKYEIWFSAEDNLKQSVDSSQACVYYDAKPPQLENVTIDGKDSLTVYIKDGVTSFPITATASDPNGIENVRVFADAYTIGDMALNTDTPAADDWIVSLNVPIATINPPTEAPSALNDGSYGIKVKAKDNAGAETEVFRTLVIDRTLPDEPGATIENSTKYTAPDDWIYVPDRLVKIRGTVSDPQYSSGIGKVEYSVNEGSEWTEVPFTATSTGASWSANIAVADKGIQFRVSDKAGNESPIKTVQVKADTAAPVLTVSSITVRDAGGANPETFLPNASIYVNNTKEIVINYTLTDGIGSGVSAAETKRTIGTAEKRFDASDTLKEHIIEKSAISGVPSTNPGLPEGPNTVVISGKDNVGNTFSKDFKITVDNTPPVLDIRVPAAGQKFTVATKLSGIVTDAGAGLKETEGITARLNGTAHDLTLTGSAWESANDPVFREGPNTVTFTVTDKLGNPTDKTVSFIYDSEDPVLSNITVNGQDGGQALVGTGADGTVNAFTVAGKVQDSLKMKQVTVLLTKAGAAGYKKEFIVAGINADNTSQSWTQSITNADLQIGGINGTGVYTVTITAEDDAGRIAVQTRTVEIDGEKPTISFETPAANATVNKKITVRGTANDNKGLKSVRVLKKGTPDVELQGVTESSGAVADKAEFAGSKGYNWSFTLDTDHKTSSGAAYPDNAALTLVVIAEDLAGNTHKAEQIVTVNQDTDRPVVKVTSFTNIASASLAGSRTLTGTVTDDDGNLKNMASDLQVCVNGGPYQNVTSSAGGALWNYELPSDISDGTVTLNFKVKDAAGTLFETGHADGALKRPKVLGDRDGDTAAKDESISFTFDTSQPSFKSEGYKFALASTFTGEIKNLGSSAILGNTSSRVASFRVWAKDISGIKSVTLAMGPEQPKTGVRNTGADEPGYEAYDINNVSLSEGNPVIKIKVTDNANYENEVSIPCIIDFTAPVIEHQAPALDGVYFNEVNLSGIITDTAPNNGIPSGVQTDTIEYKIANSAYGQHHDVDGQELSALDRTSSSWKVKIPDISKYKEVPGVTRSGSIYTVPVTVRVNDKAGNAATEKTYNIKFDPNGGTPSISIATPKVDESIGGEVLISGSASVANPASGKVVKTITLQLSLSATESSFGSTWTLNNIDYGTGKEIASNNTGINYWNHTLTQKVREAILAGAETKDVYFRLKGVNNDDLEGDWTTPRKFVLSTNVPQFSEIKLDSNTYAPNNTWIKGDASVITGKVKHNQGIKDDIHAASPASLPAGTQSLDTSGTLTIPNSDPLKLSGLSVRNLLSDNKGYEFTVPVKTSHYQQKSGYIEFDITATDKRDQNFQTVSSKVLLKYDNSKPAAVFGRAVGKFQKALFSASGASGVSVNLQGTETITDAVNRLKAHKDNLVLFAESVDGSAKAVRISDIAVDGSHARVTFAETQTNVFPASALCILLEQKPVVFDSSAAAEYQVQGFAYDTGSKTKSIAVKFGDTAAAIPNGENTQPKPLKIEPESGNFVSFTQAVKTSGLADGKHILKLTPTDHAGNAGSEYSCDVFVRNKPLKITNVSFSTDLNGSNSYSNNTTSGLVETVTRTGDGNNLDTTDRNYTQTLDIAKDFTFKNANKSQIKFTLEGGEGTARNYKIYKADSSWAVTGEAVKNGSLTAAGEIDFVPADFADGKIPQGDGQKLVIVLTDGAVGDSGRKLTLKVTLNVKTNDTRKPSVFISPFYWNAEDDNSLASNDRTKGHIEIKKVSTGAGESDVSGSVVLRGTSYHPTKLTALELTVDTAVKTATYASGAWSSLDSLTVKDIRLDVNGHWVEWEYTWTTSDVGTKAVSVKAFHNTVVSGASNAGTVTRKTAVTRSSNQSLQLASGDTAVPGQVLRIVDTVTSGSGSIDGDVSYLVTITSVEGDVVKWEHITVPVPFTAYYLYPVGYAGDEPSFNKPAMSVNVVPYVTGIKTALSKLGGTNDPDLYARTATGRYPVQDKEKIEIQGFNLSGAAVTVGGVGSGSLSGTASPWSLTLAADAKSGALDLTATPSGGSAVKVINNLTDNEKPYNKAKKTASNDKLTDDLFLDVWQFNSKAALPGRGVITEPVMRINPSNGMIGFAFANGPDFFSMSNGTSNSYTKWQKNYDDFGNVDFVYDSEGVAHGLVVGRDINSNSNHGGKFVYVTSKWGTGNTWGQGGNYGGHNSLRLEAIGQQGTIQGGSDYILDKTRIQHPSLAAAATSESGKPRLYLAYYDGINDQIRFRYGTNDKGTKGAFGHFNDQEDQDAVTAYNQDNVSIVAGEYRTSASGATPITTGNTGNTTGTYLSLGVVTVTAGSPPSQTVTDTAVLIWFDETSRMLKYTYKTNPQNGSHASQSGTGSGNWKKPIDVFDKMNVGEYCKIVVDKAGGIHIAAFDSDSADLKYAYLSSYNAASFQTATVDSYGITGTHITLDVAYTAADGKPVPYIGYYSASAGRSKLAYLVDTATGVSGSAQGTDDNGYFTGKWEVSVVPTSSRVQQDNINVGVWKTADGVIKNSVTGTNSSGTDSGTVHGNGTANPVLGYAIRQAMNGYIETAQKK